MPNSSVAMKDYHGVMLKKTKQEDKGVLKIGSMKNKDGVFEDIVAGGPQFELVDQGVVLGWLTGGVDDVGDADNSLSEVQP